MFNQRIVFFTLAALSVSHAASHELRGVLTDYNTEDERDLGILGDLWCSLFPCKRKNNTNHGGNSPVTDLINDIVNTTDGSDPLGAAFNATKGSDTPLRDFFQTLLNESDSKTPVKDYIDQAYSRSDTPLIDFIADLFKTLQGKPVRNFIKDLVNGSDSPLQDAIDGWVNDQVFADLNCTKKTKAPVCAYNLDGDEGVWICRTLYNPFKQGDLQNTTLCANPKFTLANNDNCGACDGKYPTPCTCTCDNNGTAGVYVTLDNRDGQQCVNSAWATSAINQYPQIKCGTC